MSTSMAGYLIANRSEISWKANGESQIRSLDYGFVYLASDDFAYVVGADFLIDGGVTAISGVGA